MGKVECENKMLGSMSELKVYAAVNENNKILEDLFRERGVGK